MGLNWSDGRVIQDKAEQGFKIVFNASLITTSLVNINELWDLYRASKDDIKLDGFSISKRNFGNTWQVSFWYEIGTLRLRGREAERAVIAAKTARDEACTKWKNVLLRQRDRINNRMMERTDIKELNLSNLPVKSETLDEEEDYSSVSAGGSIA